MNLNFAENFKRLRKEKGVTQEKVAEALDVSSQSVSRWELSICYPDVELLPSIANYFGVTVDCLLSNDVTSQKNDREKFSKTIDTLSDESTERIDFVREYCRKYPDEDYYAYHLVYAIRDHIVGDTKKTEKFMPLMIKNAERLLETRYRNATIELMTTACCESELSKWLDMTPYNSGFSRRACLVNREHLQGDSISAHTQQGLQMLEVLARQLNSRCPDLVGPHKKLEFQKSVLKAVESFGNGGEIPDGWKMFYAYKELVMSACLFGCGEIEQGMEHFNSAIEKCKHIYALTDEWLDIGGALFSDIKVSRDWNYAIDGDGNRHKLFAIVNMSFYDLRCIRDLLLNPRWAWFNAVRDTDDFTKAVEWVNSVKCDMV